MAETQDTTTATDDAQGDDVSGPAPADAEAPVTPHDVDVVGEKDADSEAASDTSADDTDDTQPAPSCTLGDPCDDGDPCTTDDLCTLDDDGVATCLGSPLATEDDTPCTENFCLE